MIERIGFIGLGIMGRPMALNLRKAGFPMWIYARRPELMESLVAAGAQVCTSPQAVAEHVDIVITMVSDTSDVEEVILGEYGVIQGVEAGNLVIDMSSIAASRTRHIAATLAVLGVEMLDAPVSGGEQGAIDGTLSIMVGGKAAQFERVRPLFDILGKNVVHIGDNGAGQIAKTCNQVLISQTIVAVGEALLLAKAAGVDPANVRRALLGGFASSRILELHGQRMLDHDFEPGFKAKLHQKDMRIALQTAHEVGIALPCTAIAAQYVNAVVGTGLGELDSSAILIPQEKLSGISLNDAVPSSEA